MEGTDLKPKQIRFIQEYLIDFNGTQAAIRAGYSKSGARTEAVRLLSNSEVSRFISAKLQEYSLSAEHVVKLWSDIARTNLNKYLVLTKAVKSVPRKKGLQEIINENRFRIDFEEEYMSRTKLEGKELKHHLNLVRGLKDTVLRHEIELERNSKAFRIVYEEQLVDDVEFDYVMLAKDKEAGKIKSYKQGKYGPEIEFYPADVALTNLARFYGLFKDNVSVQMTGSVSIDKWLEDNSEIITDEVIGTMAKLGTASYRK